MARATRNTQPTGAMPLPYRLDLSEREMKWLSRLAEIAYDTSCPEDEDEERFNVWLIDLQETFRQLDKNKG